MIFPAKILEREKRKNWKTINKNSKKRTHWPSSNFKQDLLSKSNNRCRHLAVSYTLHLKSNWNLKKNNNSANRILPFKRNRNTLTILYSKEESGELVSGRNHKLKRNTHHKYTRKQVNTFKNLNWKNNYGRETPRLHGFKKLLKMEPWITGKYLPPLKKTGSLLIQVIPFYKGSYNKRILTKNHNKKRANSDSSIKTKD